MRHYIIRNYLESYLLGRQINHVQHILINLYSIIPLPLFITLIKHFSHLLQAKEKWRD